MFDVDNIGFLDFEVYSPLDLKAVGTYRYVAGVSTRAIVLAYAIGNAPAVTWHADGAILDWANAPDDLRAAVRAHKTLAAWNASFDAPVWNYATLEGGAKIVWYIVPIEDRAVGMPDRNRCVADRIGQDDSAR